MIQQYLLAILAGFFISLMGTLPFGNINVTAMYISSVYTRRDALKFALGAVLVEMLYLRITLAGIAWVLSHQMLLQGLQWFTVALLCLLAYGSWTTGNSSTTAKNRIVEAGFNKFWLGVSISAVNPMQLPFWAGWATYLLTAGWLTAGSGYYNTFMLSAGLGTMAALLLFIFVGQKLSVAMKNNHRLVHRIIAGVFLTMAIYQSVVLLIK